MECKGPVASAKFALSHTTLYRIPPLCLRIRWRSLGWYHAERV